MKILVTGGAGFIGSHVAEAYLAQGHQVVVIDDLSAGHQENVPRGAEFVEMDVRSPDLEGLFKKHGFNVVNHQAARGNVRASMIDPMVFADVNVRGGVNLLENCRKYQVEKIIYASTGGCVYGELQYLPADEKHPIVPRDPYGASKAGFELYLPVYSINYGLRYTILRYPNVYGPRQDPFGEAGVVSIFARQMLRGEPAVINGDGEQERDFIYVGDVVSANLAILKKGDANTYNLGRGLGVNVNQIFRELKKLTSYQGEEIHGPAKLGEVRLSYLEASKAKAELGWEPTVSLEEGLRRTVEYFRPLVAPA